MSTAPLTTADAPLSHQDVLNDFVALGHRLVRLVVTEAEAASIPPVKAAAAFDRVTRSVRKTILLLRKLVEPVQTVNRIAARKQIIRTVEDTIQRQAEDEEADALQEELLDRLDTLDVEDEIATRPIEDIIQDIIRDLGLADRLGIHPWKRRTPTDVAELHTRAAATPSQQGALSPKRHDPVWHNPVACNSPELHHHARHPNHPPVATPLKAPASPPAASAPATVPKWRSTPPSAG